MFLCGQCHALIEQNDCKDERCPECGKNSLVKLNICKRDTGIDESGPPPWEYVCHRCRSFFRVPVPRGPDEAKQINCPDCGGKNIERFNATCLEDIEHAFG